MGFFTDPAPCIDPFGSSRGDVHGTGGVKRLLVLRETIIQIIEYRTIQAFLGFDIHGDRQALSLHISDHLVVKAAQDSNIAGVEQVKTVSKPNDCSHDCRARLAASSRPSPR